MLPRLFKECIELLVNNVVIFSKSESDNIFEKFEKALPLTSWGRIDWEKINTKIYVSSADQIIDALENLIGSPIDTSVYVLWNDASIPVIKTDLKLLLKYIDDVTSVAPDTWVWNDSNEYIIEMYHEDGGFFIGVTNK